MFETPSKVVDRYFGSEPISLHDGAINTISYTFRVTGEGITLDQKSIAQKVLNNYEAHWNDYGSRLLDSFSLDYLNNRLLIYVPAMVSNIEYEYMLGYEFKIKGLTYSAFFAYRDNRLQYTHIDEYTQS